MASRLGLTGHRGERPRGPRRRRGRSTWPTGVADGVDALVVVGGDGMVHLGVQALAGTGTPLGIIPAGTGNDVARYFDMPAQGPRRRRPTWSIAGRAPHRRPRPQRLDVLRRPCSPPGFDAMVNERANRMTWPKGQMRYNIATLAELRVFKPMPYTLELDGQRAAASRRCWSRSATARRSAAACGSPRAPMLDDGLLDVVIIKPISQAASCSGPTPSCSRAPTCSTRTTSTTASARVTVAAPGIVAYADGERIGPLPAHGRGRPRRSSVLCPADGVSVMSRAARRTRRRR